MCLYVRGEQVSMSSDGNHEYGRIDHRCEAFAESDPMEIGGLVYDIPANLLLRVDLNKLQSGITVLKLVGATIYWDQLTNRRTLDADEDIMMEIVSGVYNVEENGRRLVLEGTQGTRSVLIVLVRSVDSVNSLSAETVNERIFGQDRVSFATQYSKCSAGKLNFEPAEYIDNQTGAPVTTGVSELTIPSEVLDSFMSFEIEQQLQLAFPDSFGDFSRYDHVLYCMPAGMANGWIGYTYGRTSRSYYYNNECCGYFSLLFHEVGHNLGLQHSRQRSDEYGDKTCMMGDSYPHSESPEICFNGVKFAQLDWFPEHTLEVTLPFSGDIAAFVDVAKIQPGDVPILLHVGDTFMVFNRAKDYNRDVDVKKDEVTVARGSATPCERCISDMLGGAHENDGPMFIAEINFDDGPANVVIEACSQSTKHGVDVKTMSIRMEGEPSTCNQPDAATTAPNPVTTAPVPVTLAPVQPTTAPVLATEAPVSATAAPVRPTLAPTVKASSAPTLQASVSPPVKASSIPTVAASAIPTVQASAAPSVVASGIPTVQASAEPSIKASSSPTVTASAAPSVSDSSIPTVQASAAPSVTDSSQPTVTASAAPSVKASVAPSVADSSQPMLPSKSVLIQRKRRRRMLLRTMH